MASIQYTINGQSKTIVDANAGAVLDGFGSIKISVPDVVNPSTWIGVVTPEVGKNLRIELAPVSHFTIKSYTITVDDEPRTEWSVRSSGGIKIELPSVDIRLNAVIVVNVQFASILLFRNVNDSSTPVTVVEDQVASWGGIEPGHLNGNTLEDFNENDLRPLAVRLHGLPVSSGSGDDLRIDDFKPSFCSIAKIDKDGNILPSGRYTLASKKDAQSGNIDYMTTVPVGPLAAYGEQILIIAKFKKTNVVSFKITDVNSNHITASNNVPGVGRINTGYLRLLANSKTFVPTSSLGGVGELWVEVLPEAFSGYAIQSIKFTTSSPGIPDQIDEWSLALDNLGKLEDDTGACKRTYGSVAKDSTILIEVSFFTFI